MWLSDTSLYEVVERAWNLKIRGNPMFKIFKKLQGTKRAIKNWNQNSFGRVDILAPQLRKALDEIQTKVGLDPRNISLRAEEQDIREKNQNQIQAIEDYNGEICTEPKGIADILVNHFSFLLNHNIPMIGDLPEPQYKLSPDDAQDLVRPFKAEEIKEVVFKCDGNRAPGPDGFNGAFFKHFWYLIGEEIVSPNQFAFIKDRLIQDNVLLTHDLCHNFHKVSNTKALCLKLDLKKAYDYVIHGALLGFPPMWCTWISKCIASPSFSVLLNGSPKGFFQSTNGLRQGDPCPLCYYAW
ncbi:uncharacterized protein LOC143888525 [Tasmannia lanceolata]|uniref:uncharacterized protein LOC143888525 n=1 Tax=Tasmannia lanceolata TaxID=3420 RepID=UPI0040641E05